MRYQYYIMALNENLTCCSVGTWVQMGLKEIIGIHFADLTSSGLRVVVLRLFSVLQFLHISIVANPYNIIFSKKKILEKEHIISDLSRVLYVKVV